MYKIKLEENEATAVMTGLVQRITFCEERMAKDSGEYWKNQRDYATKAMALISAEVSKDETERWSHEQELVESVLEAVMRRVDGEISYMIERGVYDMAHAKTKKERMYLLTRDTLARGVRNNIRGAIRDCIKYFVEVPF